MRHLCVCRGDGEEAGEGDQPHSIWNGCVSKGLERRQYCITEKDLIKEYTIFYGRWRKGANYIKVISPVKTFPLVVSSVPRDNIQISAEWPLCSCSGGLTIGSWSKLNEKSPESTLLHYCQSGFFSSDFYYLSFLPSPSANQPGLM